MPKGVYPHPHRPMPQATRSKLSSARRSYLLPTKETLAELYYNQGLSVRTIGERLNIPWQSLFIFMKRYELPLRSGSQAQVLYQQKHPELAKLFSIRCSTSGRHPSPEATAKRLSSRKGYSHSATTRAKMSASRKGQKWSAETREKCLPIVMKNRLNRPTSLEVKVALVIENHKLPYKYVGDGYTWIAGRCPDFLNVNGRKQVVEVFSRWWHDPLVNPQVKPQHTEADTISHYVKYGFDCVILWENELTEEIILSRLGGTHV